MRTSLIACLLLAVGTASAQTMALKPLETGAMSKMGGYRPQRVTLSADKPASITKLPEGLDAPLFGVLPIGSAGTGQKAIFHLVVNEPEGKEATLYVDANGNGDLTDDAAAEWKPRTAKNKEGVELTQYNGGASVQLGPSFQAHLGMYRFDKNDAGRPALKNVLLFYADYAFEGEASVGGKTYKSMLTDDNASGDFRGSEIKPDDEKASSGVRFSLDLNGNGKFDRQGEAFDIRKPFNIGGTTYEVADMPPSGGTFKIVKSTKTVAEIPLPPNHSAGQKITAFTATTTDGKEIKFPESYKGKIVLIDFWATWCGPCMAEVPNLVSVYEEFHGKGLEVLGISLDKESQLDKVQSVTADNKMTWPQVYDGKFWQARIAQLYVVQSIPAAYLVDGDTGEILADTGLRGETLKATIQKALEKKQASQKG